ncbi:CDP-alcohol phosphatidyltransferase family protein [Sphingomonas sp. PB2P19]|uniref:CDP-alcohol phosphatidyltransferase family protein n=1 Tax=Sphingomonas rhamnosi TaxID=3096156 RepID=UPI002FC7A7BB
MPFAIARRISANAVSGVGLCLGAGAALAYAQWHDGRFAVLGLLLSIGWLIADGLDGMVARATGSASAFGRMLDGLVDHGVFAMIYTALAITVNTPEGWVLAFAAGGAHAVQSSLYEGERARFHRRVKGVALAAPAVPTGNALVRLYDSLAGSIDRVAMPFERTLAQASHPVAMGRSYGARATPPLRLLSLLTANVRVAAIFVACFAGNPRIFWWFEIVVLTIVAIVGLVWHRRVERAFVRSTSRPSAASRMHLS